MVLLHDDASRWYKSQYPCCWSHPQCPANEDALVYLYRSLCHSPRLYRCQAASPVPAGPGGLLLHLRVHACKCVKVSNLHLHVVPNWSQNSDGMAVLCYTHLDVLLSCCQISAVCSTPVS